ncbi:hypothetical protein JCM5353_001302 [Sporobolomyces roseus]
MLPWNPPSSFSLNHQSNSAGDPPRYNNQPYSDQPNYQHQPNQFQSMNQHQQPQQNQQPQHPQQQQQQQAQQQAASFPPMTLASTLHFLQSEHRRYARDRNEWEIERAEMRARIALLEGEKRGNEGALKSLGRRCKMLEMALRGERSKFLSTTNALASNASPSGSGTASPIPGGVASVGPGTPSLVGAPSTASIKLPSEKDKELVSAIAPAKLAALQKEGGGGGLPPSGEAKSTAMAPSTSSPGIAANTSASTPSLNLQPPPNGTAAGTNTGTWGLTMGGTLGGRDPRGKARSRDYLKQCLQEITYLTSSTTLNPLSTTSYAAPQVPRPRKTLPDYIPPVTSASSSSAPSASAPTEPPVTTNGGKVPGMINLAGLGGLSKPTATTTASALEMRPTDSDSSTIPPAPSMSTSNGPTNPSLLAPSSSTFPTSTSMTSASDPPSAFIPLSRTPSRPGNDSEAEQESQRPTLSSEFEDQSEGSGKEETKTKEEITEESSLPAITESEAKEETKDEAESVDDKLSTRLDLNTDRAKRFDDNNERGDIGIDESKRSAEGEGVRGVGTMSSGNSVTEDGGGKGREGQDENGAELITAFYRPGSSEDWKEQLREAGRRAYPSSFNGGSVSGGDKELENLEWDMEDSEEKEGKKSTTCKKTLKGHLDAVRAIKVFEGEKGFEIASAGDDFVVKFWRNVLAHKSSRSEVEPVITYRGHSAPVTAIAISTRHRLVFSGSIDGTVQIHRLPSAEHSLYDPVDTSLDVGSLEPNSNALWAVEVFGAEDEYLALIAADGSTQVWDWKERKLVKSWSWEWSKDEKDNSLGKSGKKKLPQSPNPTALAIVTLGGKELLAVAYQNAVVKIYDPETGEIVKRLASDESSDGLQETQINAIAVHPHFPFLATGHEDRFIRIFDLSSSSQDPILSTLAHLDGVTSLAFSPSSPADREGPHRLLTVSHDASLRFWNLSASSTSSSPNLTCIQEVTSHRVKSAEGILDLAFAQDGKTLVTSGADSTVRVWQK